MKEHSDDLLRLKRAFHAIEKLQAKLNALEHAKTEPVAVIGIGCRFPGGVDSPETCWQLLHNGVDAITEVPPDRWDIEKYYDSNPDIPGKMYTPYGGFLSQPIDMFDPQFFGISPREAANLDPQQRLLLEVCWEALEHGNQLPEQLFNSLTGVFVGISSFDYVLWKAGQPQHPNHIDAYYGTGSAFSAATGRLAYTLGLKGSCMAIDTACSSSLVAVHVACQHLRNKECNLALAGGVNLLLSPEASITFSKARMLAPDGHCKTFDASADGYVRGEGCGMVVLKRLSDAIAGGDTIFAVIRGSAVNQDGASGGLTVPSGPSQEEVIRHALTGAGLDPQQVSYIEAHGTGTSLGDPIELGSLAEVFGKDRPQDNPLTVCSVKTNIGHLEAAAGIAGLIKAALALYKKEIPPHLNFKQPTPHFPWTEFPFLVPTAPKKWDPGKNKRIAGISSFGFSGTNAHLILEEAPDNQQSTIDNQQSLERPLHLLTLSAKTEEALKQLAGRYGNHLANHQDLALEHVCFTANTCRSHFSHRLSGVASSSDEMREKLAAFVSGQKSVGLIQGKVTGSPPSNIAFLFTGQGSQYVGMGRQLYETQPTFRQILDRCDEILRACLEKPLLEVLYPDKELKGFGKPFSSDLQSSIINQTAYTQPAIFALEYALAELWKSWGITPAVVMGHSIGEYAAACVAGVFSLEDGLKLVAERGRLMQALPQDGQMVAVLANEARVSEAIQAYADEVSIAAINGPKSVVISGKREAVEAISTTLQAEGIKTKPLTVSHAFHSPLMDPMLKDFEQVAREVTFFSPQIDLISDVSGNLATTEVMTPEYWRQHVRSPVRFFTSIQTLYQLGYEVFLEIGAKPILSGLGRQIGEGEEIPTPSPSQEGKQIGEGEEIPTPDPSQEGKQIGEGEEIPTPSPSQEGKQQAEGGKFSTALWLPSLRAGRPDWQQMLDSLGQLFVRGVSVDWAGFDKEYPRRRVLLPTYPFQRQRYWSGKAETEHPEGEALPGELLPQAQTSILKFLNQGETDQLTQLLEKSGKFSEDQMRFVPEILEELVQQHHLQLAAVSLKNWSYEIKWQLRPRQFHSGEDLIKNQEPGIWLIATDKQGLGQALAQRLQEYDQHCLLIYAGDVYEVLGNGSWSLNPADLSEFKRFWKEEIEKRELPLKKILHLWGLDAAPPDELRLSDLEQAQRMGCGSLLHLVQLLAGRKDLDSPQLWVITRGSITVKPGVQSLSFVQAPLWGLGKVVALEHQDLWGGMIDLETEVGEGEAETVLTEILDSEGEDQLAFRNGRRYVARLKRSKLPESQAGSSPPGRGKGWVKPDAAYLISGGLGALGLRVAQWMVEQGARHLVLTGRRGITKETQQETVSRLEDSGAKVLVAQADVSKEEDMEKMLAEIHTSLPPLKGVVHAAGVLDDGILAQQTWDRFVRVMNPKVNGTWNLHVLTKDLPLDFFVCFSSVASLFGSAGQGNYAAANAFMDALAHYRQALGLPGLSINWGPWAETGMAAGLDARAQKHFTAHGLNPISPDAGLQVLGHLLGSPKAQIGILMIDWKLFGQQPLSRSQRLLLSGFIREEVPLEKAGQEPARESGLIRQLQEAPVSERKELLTVHIQTEVARVLELDSSQLPELQQGFMDMGMDSLMAVDLKNRLESDLGVSLAASIVFDYPTIQDLVEYIVKEILKWESPAEKQKSPKPEAEKTSEIQQLSEKEIEASIKKELEELETLIKEE